VNEEGGGAAGAGGLELADLLALLTARFEERPLAEEQVVCQGREDVAPLLAELGDQPQALREEETLGQRR
jgi:hypothetical protein